MASVTSDDVAVSLGRPLSGTESDQADMWISDAELQIRVRLGDLTLLDQDVLTYVVREAVVARMRNPDGVQSEQVDDYRYNLPANTRQITILDEWWRMLSPDVGSGAFSARPYFEVDSARWPTSVGEGVYFDSTWWQA